jgi:DNA polymerase-3 subunit epsilon
MRSNGSNLNLRQILDETQVETTMKDFAAIDFETANFERSSVCSVGVVIYRNGVKVDEFYSLIKPVPEYYMQACINVHGMTAVDTAEAPLFPEVWKQIAPKIEGLPLVAHNKAFDETCLKAVFRVYQMDYPDYPFYCTLQQSRKVWKGGHHNLDIIAERCGFNLKNHHHALADAEACAAIALAIL